MEVKELRRQLVILKEYRRLLATEIVITKLAIEAKLNTSNGSKKQELYTKETHISTQETGKRVVSNKARVKQR